MDLFFSLFFSSLCEGVVSFFHTGIPYIACGWSQIWGPQFILSTHTTVINMLIKFRLFFGEWQITFQIFLYIYLLLKKLVNEKYFLVNRKHFPEVVKNLKISYYLMIMLNLVLKFFISIYFVWIFFFKFIP